VVDGLAASQGRYKLGDRGGMVRRGERGLGPIHLSCEEWRGDGMGEGILIALCIMPQRVRRRGAARRRCRIHSLVQLSRGGSCIQMVEQAGKLRKELTQGGFNARPS